MSTTYRILRYLFFLVIVRPIVYIFLGLNVRHLEQLVQKGPAVIVANHNSHLDTLVLMSLFPLKMLPYLRPVAAKDYFTKNRVLEWFTLNIIGAILLDRHPSGHSNPLEEASSALKEGAILIFYPEGSRGEAEHLSLFKSGISHLMKSHSNIPVCPIFLHGLGKALPKNDWLPVPFFIDVFVGEAIYYESSRKAFMDKLNESIHLLAAEGSFPAWE